VLAPARSCSLVPRISPATMTQQQHRRDPSGVAGAHLESAGRRSARYAPRAAARCQPGPDSNPRGSSRSCHSPTFSPDAAGRKWTRTLPSDAITSQPAGAWGVLTKRLGGFTPIASALATLGDECDHQQTDQPNLETREAQGAQATAQAAPALAPPQHAPRTRRSEPSRVRNARRIPSRLAFGGPEAHANAGRRGRGADV